MQKDIPKEAKEDTNTNSTHTPYNNSTNTQELPFINSFTLAHPNLHDLSTLEKSEKKNAKPKVKVMHGQYSPIKIDSTSEIISHQIKIPINRNEKEGNSDQNSDSELFASSSPYNWAEHDAKEQRGKFEEGERKEATQEVDSNVKKAIETVKKKYNFEKKRPRNQSIDKISSEGNTRVLFDPKRKSIVTKDAQSISINSTLFSPNSSNSSKGEEAKEGKDTKFKHTIIEIPLPKEELNNTLKTKTNISELRSAIFKFQSFFADELPVHQQFQKIYSKVLLSAGKQQRLQQ